MKKKVLAFIKIFDVVMLAATIVFCGVISFLDFSGLLGSSEMKDRIPTFTLLAVALLGFYILLERRGQLSGIHDKVQTISQSGEVFTRRIIESLDGVDVTRFENQLSCLQYVNKRLRSTSKSIDDLSWAPARITSDDLEVITTERSKHRDLVHATARKIPYREIFIFNEGRKEKLRDSLSLDTLGYSCGYYDTVGKAPLLQFMIVDEEEVIVLTGGYTYLAFRHAKLVTLFRQYYEDIWTRSSKLKIGIRADFHELEKVLGTEKTAVLKEKMTSAVPADLNQGS